MSHQSFCSSDGVCSFCLESSEAFTSFARCVCVFLSLFVSSHSLFLCLFLCFCLCLCLSISAPVSQLASHPLSHAPCVCSVACWTRSRSRRSPPTQSKRAMRRTRRAILIRTTKSPCRLCLALLTSRRPMAQMTINRHLIAGLDHTAISVRCSFDCWFDRLIGSWVSFEMKLLKFY